MTTRHPKTADAGDRKRSRFTILALMICALVSQNVNRIHAEHKTTQELSSSSVCITASARPRDEGSLTTETAAQPEESPSGVSTTSAPLENVVPVVSAAAELSVPASATKTSVTDTATPDGSITSEVAKSKNVMVKDDSFKSVSTTDLPKNSSEKETLETQFPKAKRTTFLSSGIATTANDLHDTLGKRGTALASSETVWRLETARSRTTETMKTMHTTAVKSFVEMLNKTSVTETEDGRESSGRKGDITDKMSAKETTAGTQTTIPTNDTTISTDRSVLTQDQQEETINPLGPTAGFNAAEWVNKECESQKGVTTCTQTQLNEMYDSTAKKETATDLKIHSTTTTPEELSSSTQTSRPLPERTIKEETESVKSPISAKTGDSDDNCSHVHFVNKMLGHIEWDSSYSDCISPLTWKISVPPGYVVTLKIFRILVGGKHSLQIFTPIPTAFASRVMQPVTREYTESTYEYGFSPILSIYNNLSIVVLPSTEGFTFFNISYYAHWAGSLPWSVFNHGKPETESVTKYNCSTNVTVPEVFRCDMAEQCTDGRDEVGCDYKGDGTCGDWIPYGDNCLRAFFVKSFTAKVKETITMPLRAQQKCRADHGATLALLPDNTGTDLVTNMIRHTGFMTASVGLKKVKPVSPHLRHLYRFLWQWGGWGSPMAYEQLTIQREGPLHDCAQMNIYPEPRLRPLHCIMSDEAPEGYVCMRRNSRHPETQSPKILSVHFPQPSTTVNKVPTKSCPDGSLVQVFHPCTWDGWKSEGTYFNLSPANLPLFKCRFGQEVHYTLVCDGHDDCADGSDEIGCVQPRLSTLLHSFFRCHDGQTVPWSSHCNGVPDCFDDSDEEDCLTCTGNSVMCSGATCFPEDYTQYIESCPQIKSQEYEEHSTHFNRGRLPSYRSSEGQQSSAELNRRNSGATWVSLSNGMTGVASVHLDGNGMSTLTATDMCAESEFQCLNGLCIPSFLVNNGEQDCMHGEDEDIPGHNITCPGYYRCEEAGLCVHHDYLCDGVYHCPNKDDERYCDLTCPLNCSCEGHAYTCFGTFYPDHNLQLRYLDLSGTSDPPLDNMNILEFLQFLNLSSCCLKVVKLIDMPQLRVLDLTFNKLSSLSSLFLENLSGLVNLDLSHNPLVKVLDASFKSLSEIAGMKALQVLTMQNTSLVQLEDRALERLPHLVTLDLRQNSIKRFDKSVLWGLGDLRVLYTDNNKLCCDVFHPHQILCHAPEDELSSCSDLLRLDFFRFFLWCLSVLAISGNTGCLIYRLFFMKQAAPLTTRILVGNLAASDLVMGMYLMIIGLADTFYRNVYVSKEAEWKESALCRAAGFLAFVANEVSAVMVCLVTVERFLVLRFPLNPAVHMTVRVAVVSCSFAWTTGLALAAVPLVAQWEFYGQNGICLPMPITRLKFEGQSYAFVVFIALNFVLFLAVGVLQGFLFHSIQRTSARAGVQRRQQDALVARRLFLVVFTDFLCWFPISLMGLLAAQGTPVPDVVNVWVAIFVLPLNSALNPFLYTLNALAERWHKQREESRIRKTMNRLHQEIPKWSASTIEDLTRMCIRSKRVRRERVIKWLGRPSLSSSDSEVDNLHRQVSLHSERSENVSISFSDFEIAIGDSEDAVKLNNL